VGSNVTALAGDYRVLMKPEAKPTATRIRFAAGATNYTLNVTIK
jgi:hypothetical protein